MTVHKGLEHMMAENRDDSFNCEFEIQEEKVNPWTHVRFKNNPCSVGFVLPVSLE